MNLLPRTNALPYVVCVEIDGQIVSSLSDYSPDEEGAIRHTAAHIRGACLAHAHIRQSGRYVAHVATNYYGDVFAEIHVVEAGHSVCYSVRVSDDGVLIPTNGEYVPCLDC